MFIEQSHVVSRGAFFKIKLTTCFLDILILRICVLITKPRDFRGDVTCVLAQKATRVAYLLPEERLAACPLAQRCPSDSSACSKAESLIPRPRPSMARPEVESRLPKAPASPLREFLQLEKAALVVSLAEQVSISEVFF